MTGSVVNGAIEGAVAGAFTGAVTATTKSHFAQLASIIVAAPVTAIAVLPHIGHDRGAVVVGGAAAAGWLVTRSSNFAAQQPPAP